MAVVTQCTGRAIAWLCPCRNAAAPLLAIPLLMLMLSALALGLNVAIEPAEIAVEEAETATLLVAALEPRLRGISALGLPS